MQDDEDEDDDDDEDEDDGGVQFWSIVNSFECAGDNEGGELAFDKFGCNKFN